MAKYRVMLSKTEPATTHVVVEAENEREAEALAWDEDDAGRAEWNYKNLSSNAIVLPDLREEE